MSVDLAGSTAYKAANSAVDSSVSPKPTWVRDMEDFYREFPTSVAAHYNRVFQHQALGYEANPPRVWKRVGDEIILCARLNCLEHLAVCVLSFKHALHEYGAHLEATKKKLDVKGYAWVAAFPAPNVTVFDDGAHDIDSEDTERLVDENPSQYDFLGRDIDAGFRTSRFCSPSKMSYSIELAYLMAKCARADLLQGLKFVYDGSHVLKGVIGEEPYPVFYSYVERSTARRELRDKEARLREPVAEATPINLHDYVEAFLDEMGLERPVLGRYNDIAPLPLPTSYIEYAASWETINKEVVQRAASEEAAADQDGDQPLPADVDEAAETILAEAPIADEPAN